MRNQRHRRLLTLTLLITLSLSGGINISQAAIKAGSPCTSVGKTTKSAGVSYQCVKSGKKLLWKKVVNPVVASPSTPVAPIVPVVATGVKYQPEGCHAKVSATLQKKVNETWVDIAPAEGWEKIAECDADHPFKPYLHADLANGTVIRWKVYVPGGWEWFSNSLTVKTIVIPTVGQTIPAIPASKYGDVAEMARKSILSDMPETKATIATTFVFEDSIPDIERKVIQGGVTKTLAHYSPYFDSTFNFHIFVFATSAFLKNEAPKADPTNTVFGENMARQSLTWGGRDPRNCVGMGGFAVPETPFPFIAIDAPCTQNDGAAYGVLPHEITHSLQMKIGSANSRCWAPIWLVEGQPQVAGSAFATSENGDAYAAHHKSWVDRIVKPDSVAPLKVMEGETTDFSEYTLGGALSEYLVAKGGWKRSLDLFSQAASQSASACLSGEAKLANFNKAFLALYGESVDDFYQEALPYLQWVAANKK